MSLEARERLLNGVSDVLRDVESGLRQAKARPREHVPTFEEIDAAKKKPFVDDCIAKLQRVERFST